MPSLTKTFRFEASHVLPNHPGKCSNLHGHSWVLTVEVSGPVEDFTGMVMDYTDITIEVSPIIADLDHAHLGAWQTDKVHISYGETKAVQWLEIPDFNPTSENLLLAIAKQLVKRSFVFSKLTLNETCTTSCSLTWEEFNGRG